MTRRQPKNRGWTQQSPMVGIFIHAIQRFQAVHPWITTRTSFGRSIDLQMVMFTAAEVLELHPHIPASMEPQYGHNDGPSWNECVELARRDTRLLFSGFLKSPARADEGIDLDAVYVPQPDPGDVLYTQAITRPDGTRHPPDEDDPDQIDGQPYRRLWWD